MQAPGRVSMTGLFLLLLCSKTQDLTRIRLPNFMSGRFFFNEAPRAFETGSVFLSVTLNYAVSAAGACSTGFADLHAHFSR